MNRGTQGTQPKKMINKDQKKIIWTIWKTKVKLDDEELYRFIEHNYKKENMSDLTFLEADLLISTLRRITGETAGKLTRKQRYAIISHQKELGWSDTELAGFVKKQTGIEHYDWLSPTQASTVISGLVNYRKWLRKKKRN
ncbi:MAG: phage protein GemA/Gp16 family protein [bacterium]